MKTFLLLCCIGFCVSLQSVRATHIVGGALELTVKESRTYTYTLALNLYFDAVNGLAGARDANVSVVIFSKRTGQPVSTHILPLTSTTRVPYTNPVCVSEKLVTDLLRYQLDIRLPLADYNDAFGYYAVWERCCRNNVIVNIVSPEAAGNSFYLEFPAVTANNRQFINNSPVFDIPKGDFACVNEPFLLNFNAQDADNDELRYSLVTPYTSFSTRDNPRPLASSGPYPPINWIPGISLANVIPGPQPLRVNPVTGQLRVTAGRTGLFVFSVLCEEFRDGVKIGGVRQDFQLLVVDCPRNDAPKVQLKEKAGSGFYRAGQIIKASWAQGNRCVNLSLTDVNNQENVRVSIRPINFPGGITITPAQGVIRNAQDTLRAQLCWDNCVASKPGEPLEFDVIVQDDGCPLPKADTLRVKMEITPQPNQAPRVQTDLPGNAAMVMEGNKLNFNVLATDTDNDQITLEAVGRGFDIRTVGMSFVNGTAQGTLTTPFVWQPPCDKVKEGQTYTVDFIVTDRRCPGQQKKDTVTVNLQFKNRPNRQPDVSTTLPGNYVSVRPGGEIRFNVLGSDADNDPVVVRATGRGFSLAEAGIQFKNNATGIGRLNEPFVWTPDCKTLELKPDGIFIIDFLLQDNSCAPNRTDTVSVEVNVKDFEFVFKNDSVPNVFTPNGDQWNQTFELAKYLPPDNCQDQFEKIEIYNRWGLVVYETANREFIWSGFGFPAGVYYYLIKYRRNRYKGTVSLLR